MEKLKKYKDNELYLLARKKPELAGKAFGELYDRYAGEVYKYSLKILGSQELAEDVLQETFLRLYKSTFGDNAMTNFKAFLITIARNQCLTIKKSKYTGLANIEDIVIPHYDENYEKKEMLELIRSTIDCLPGKYREPFVLREYNNLSYPEIAEILGISIANVKIRIYRAKKDIQKTLSPYVKDLVKKL